MRRRTEALVSIAVTDNGIGIAPDAQADIFVATLAGWD
jgi:signal transduction histidine kinase